MTFPKKTVLASLLLLSTTSAFAVDTAELIVTGTIAPVACTPLFSGGGTVDYGAIPTASLSTTAVTPLAEKTIDFIINCDSPIAIGFHMIDNRVGDAILIPGVDTGRVYGLGKQDGVTIGGYSIAQDASVFMADGNLADIIATYNLGANWTDTFHEHMPVNGSTIFSAAPIGGTVPGAYRSLSGKLKIKAAITATNKLDLTESIKLDGLSTLTVRYM